MILISGTVTVQADKIEEAKVAFIIMQDASTAEEGCISYRFFQDLEDPTVFRLFEEWETQDALPAHNESSHMADFRAKQPNFVAGKDLNRYEVGSYGKL
jgi:quinol monooxygenase YgiN